VPPQWLYDAVFSAGGPPPRGRSWPDRNPRDGDGCETCGVPPQWLYDAVFSAGGPPPRGRPWPDPNPREGEGSVLQWVVMADIKVLIKNRYKLQFSIFFNK